MIWRDSLKRNGLRFLSLYSTNSALLDVTGEDSMLFYWQRGVVQRIKCRGANNCGIVTNNYFLMIDLIFSEYIYFN